MLRYEISTSCTIFGELKNTGWFQYTLERGKRAFSLIFSISRSTHGSLLLKAEEDLLRKRSSPFLTRVIAT